MPPTPQLPLTDLRGGARLAIDTVGGITSLVEALHVQIARAPTRLAGPVVGGAVRGIGALVYRSIRAVTGTVGGGIDLALRAAAPALRRIEPWPAREAVLAALNGVLGDYLHATGNPLAIPMGLRYADGTLVLSPLLTPAVAPVAVPGTAPGAAPAIAPGHVPALAAAPPAAGPDVLLLVHGLCMNHAAWQRNGQDHGAALARDLGFTPLYLHYNTGLHVSTNGRALAQLLETLFTAWPVPLRRLTIVAHSMGGLVARSACHYAQAAGLDWRARLRELVFLGTPQQGAPLERGGHWIDLLLAQTPYTAPFARLGRIRSAGITDLRHGLVLDEEWQGQDRFARHAAQRSALPLPADVACHAIAASRRPPPPAGTTHRRLASDGLVPVASALGRHRSPRLALHFAPQRQWIAYGCGHLDLLERADVYERIRGWLA
jgi:hypothetical protein